MISEFHREKLIPFQQKHIEELEALLEQAPLESRSAVEEVLRLNKRILRLLGHRTPRVKKGSPQHPFPLEKTRGGQPVTITEQEADPNKDKKKPKRISAQLRTDVELLDKQGVPVAAISDQLMIVEETITKIVTELRKKNQPQNVILAEGIKA
jgi:hypothetical protein